MSDEVLKSIIDNLNNSPLKSHADAIGMMCVLWSKLEFHLDILLVGLLDTDPETMAAVLANMKMKEKINSIKSIGHAKKPSEKWYNELDTVLKEIDGTIRIKRNRLIHDYWFDAEDKVFQVEMMAKVIKPQARQTAPLYQKVSETPVGEILALQVMILSATGRLLEVIKSRGRDA